MGCRMTMRELPWGLSARLARASEIDDETESWKLEPGHGMARAELSTNGFYGYASQNLHPRVIIPIPRSLYYTCLDFWSRKDRLSRILLRQSLPRKSELVPIDQPPLSSCAASCSLESVPRSSIHDTIIFRARAE